MITSEIKVKIIETFGKTYTPRILSYFKKQNVVSITGTNYTGGYIRSIVGGFQENPLLESQLMEYLILESRKQKLLKKKILKI